MNSYYLDKSLKTHIHKAYKKLKITFKKYDRNVIKLLLLKI